MADIKNNESNHAHCIYCILGALNYQPVLNQDFRKNCIDILLAYGENKKHRALVVMYENKVGIVPEEAKGAVITGYDGLNLLIFQTGNYKIITKV